MILIGNLCFINITPGQNGINVMALAWLRFVYRLSFVSPSFASGGPHPQSFPLKCPKGFIKAKLYVRWLRDARSCK